MQRDKTGKLERALKQSPINYFSDLFICAMVLLWIADNVYESIVATGVTVASIVLSLCTGTNCFDTSMWSSIGSNIALPLSCGGALWMVKNGVQHALANRRGEQAHMDFPRVGADGEDNGAEQQYGGSPDDLTEEPTQEQNREE